MQERLLPSSESSSSSREWKSLRNQAWATLGASLLGTGMLAQPKAGESIGIVLFVLLSLTAMLLGHTSSMMLCRASVFLNAQGVPKSTVKYSELVSLVFGRRGEMWTMWTLTVMQLGSCIGFIIVTRDVFTPLIDAWTNWSPTAEEVVFSLSGCVVLPLSVFVRDLSSFRYTSTASIVIIFFFVLVVVTNAVYVVSSSDPNSKRMELIHDPQVVLSGPFLWPQGVKALRAFSLVSFAYFMQYNVLPVLNTLKTLGPVEGEACYLSASRRSFLLSGVITMLFGLFGYLTFLSTTESDILSNFLTSGTYISSFLNFVRAFYGMALLLTYPLVLWEARENVKSIWFGPGDAEPVTSQSNPKTLFAKESFLVHALITCVLVLVTATVGSLVSDLSVVFGLIGSACTPVVGYALPAALYLKSGAASHHVDWYRPFVILVVALVMIPLGLAVWVLSTIMDLF